MTSKNPCFQTFSTKSTIIVKPSNLTRNSFCFFLSVKQRKKKHNKGLSTQTFLFQLLEVILKGCAQKKINKIDHKHKLMLMKTLNSLLQSVVWWKTENNINFWHSKTTKSDYFFSKAWDSKTTKREKGLCRWEIMQTTWVREKRLFELGNVDSLV